MYAMKKLPKFCFEFLIWLVKEIWSPENRDLPLLNCKISKITESETNT